MNVKIYSPSEGGGSCRLKCGGRWKRPKLKLRFTNSILASEHCRLLLCFYVGLCLLVGSSSAGFACLSNPCVFGVCIDDLNSTYSCYCIDGYTGIQCQTNWDECWSSPCQNGGICIDGVAQYNCSCPEGFVGPNCEENLDECLSNPCQNGGTCYDRDNGYQCSCLAGFIGAHCELDVAVCDTGNGERCHNGGECMEGKGLEFTCNCAPGWESTYCDSEINECKSSPCQNGAVCVDKLANYACACSMGYTGENCEEEVMVCSDSPCFNDALCLMEEGLPVCYCVPDFHGDKCEFKYDECQLMQPRCTNGGSCIDGIDDFSCSCPPGLTGTYCECLILDSEQTLDCNYTAPEQTTNFFTTTEQITSIFLSTTDFFVKTTTTPTDYYTIDEITKSSNVPNQSTSQTTTVDTTMAEFLTDITANPVLSTRFVTSSSTALDQTSDSTTFSSGQTEYTTTEEKIIGLSGGSIDTTKSYTTTTSPLPPPSTLTPFFTDYPESSGTITKFTTISDTNSRTSGTTTTTMGSVWTPMPTTKTTSTTTTTTPTTTTKPLTTIPFYTGSPDCMQIPCLNGGTCAVTSEGTKCVCRFDKQGALCEQSIRIRNAAFGGDSYLSHRIYKQSTDINYQETMLSIRVEIKARTRATDGLLLLATVQGTRGSHYMALFLHKGLLQFQFSCGLQTMLLSELETPVNTGNEILIQAELDFSRNNTHCNASLRVNDTLAMSGDQPTWINLLPHEMRKDQIIQSTWLHLGGTPQAPIGLINGLAGGQGFTGCLHSLKINGNSKNIYSEALDGFGITECGSLACLSNPCRNGALCVELNNDKSNNTTSNNDKNDFFTKIIMESSSKQPKINDKWKCKCPTGFMGSTCEISICDNNPCQYGATCVTFPGSGYLCLCPLGKHGHYCEHNLEVAQPHFSGSVTGLSSYIAYPVPLPLEYSVELDFKILPTTMSQISLLAFLGQTGYHDEKSDHLAVSFIQGYIMLTWNLGSGPRRIFTQKPLDFKDDSVRTAIDIRVGRIGRQAWLSIDGKVNISGRAPGSLTRMDVLPILYLGGHEISNFTTLPHDLPLHSGFQGCIFDVHLKAGLVTVPLQETRGIRGRGVGQCGTRECHRYACQNNGACLHHGSTFSCVCQEGWYGPLCSQSSNPCDSGQNRCSVGSTCVPLVNGYECDCQLGKTGRNCDQDIKSLSDVAMTGRRSFLSIKLPDKSSYPSANENEISYQKLHQPLNVNSSSEQILIETVESSLNNHPVLLRFMKGNAPNTSLPRTSPTLMVTAPASGQHHRVQYFSVEFQIRPLSERGLLMYYGAFDDNLDRSFGFLSLSLQGGVVEFRISTPNNYMQIVRSVRMLAIGEWHKIKVTQSGRRLTLWVEGTAAAALASSSEVLIHKDSLIYIGGLPDLSRLPYNSISGFPIPFRGCIRQLVISGTRIILNESNILESRNINDCDGTPCGGDSCESGGQCWLDETMQPHCKCPENAKGIRCEYKESCKYIKCKNNGKCSSSGACNCPNGWGGFYCEIATNKESRPSFRGNSFMLVPPPRIPVKDKRNGPVLYVRPKELVKISLNFSTIYLDGLLFWSSNSASKFVGLGIDDGHIKLASNLLDTTSATVDIPTGGFVADGGWYNVQIEIDRKFVQLTVDGRPIFTENKRIVDLKTIDENLSIGLEDLFYIGGFPNNESVQDRTGNKFKRPFVGCLQDISFGGRTTDFTSQHINDFSSYDGENIGSCELYDDFSNV